MNQDLDAHGSCAADICICLQVPDTLPVQPVERLQAAFQRLQRALPRLQELSRLPGALEVDHVPD